MNSCWDGTMNACSSRAYQGDVRFILHWYSYVGSKVNGIRYHSVDYPMTTNTCESSIEETNGTPFPTSVINIRPYVRLQLFDQPIQQHYRRVTILLRLITPLSKTSLQLSGISRLQQFHQIRLKLSEIPSLTVLRNFHTMINA